ncbi:DUF2795 domain-containing protein [Arthrobacter sp. A5]|uniref:DUF2795 domain-containing protein n=1 Tax=Arthrobacter sp. A5 TaxID=576926 RepID=UPI003DA99C9A
MSNSPNPIQIQKFLGGIDYPASRAKLVSKAEDSGADEPVLEALRNIPDREFNGPNAVSQAVSEGSKDV